MTKILVTGAATWAGGRLIQVLQAKPGVEVLAVDEIRSSTELGVEVCLFELDNPDFAHFVIAAKPDAIVHLQTVDRSALLGGRRAHDEAVVGAQALFGAIHRCRSIKHVIVKSDLCVYGLGPRNPSVVTEDAALEGRRDRYANDLKTVEGFMTETAEVRADCVFTILRFAPIFGQDVTDPLSRYLRLPVVPTRIGYDPRMQLISGADAVRALSHAIEHPVGGAINIAAPGQLYLSRILRLGNRLAQPLPRRAYDIAIRGLARADLHIPDHIKRLIHHGIVADTRRMDEVLGFVPTQSLRQAVLDGYGRLIPRPAAP